MKTNFFRLLTLSLLILTDCKSSVDEINVDEVILNHSVISVAEGGEIMLTAKILPFTTLDISVEWESSDSKIATVKDGVVKGIAIGTTIIMARVDDKTASCSVTVKPAIVGVYYFDGWAGRNSKAFDPNEPWAANAPTHLTRRFVEEFAGRQPVWGWRDDTQEIMERQIDLAADNGVDFFLYCWYWHDNLSRINTNAIENDSKHTGMKLHFTAANKERLRFALLVANHSGAEIIGDDNWAAAVKYWAQYFRDPLYMTVDGKPLIVLFGTSDITVTSGNLAAMQEAAVKEGFKNGLSIAGCGGNTRNKEGFTHTTHYNVVPGYSAGSERHDFSELIVATEAQWIGSAEQPYIPLLTSGWDKRPWEGPTGSNQVAGWYFTGDTPDVFKGFLKDAITWMDNNPLKTIKDRVVLIYAWNEIGEGGYLVPTLDDPDAQKLKKIKELLDEYK